MGPKTPLILVNFKTDREAFGEKALRLARICEALAERHGVGICVAPHLLDLRHVAESVDIPVFAQHFHPVGKGKATGHIPAESLKLAGASGVIINHCEKPLPMEEIRKRVESAREWGMASVVCAANAEAAEGAAGLSPDFISYEPPEYIGSAVASVAKARPGMLRDAVRAVAETSPKTRVLCGAGISTDADVRAALSLGSCGILVSRAVVKAEDPRALLEGFCRATAHALTAVGRDGRRAMTAMA